jgi:hypothetical protein
MGQQVIKNSKLNFFKEGVAKASFNKRLIIFNSTRS